MRFFLGASKLALTALSSSLMTPATTRSIAPASLAFLPAPTTPVASRSLYQRQPNLPTKSPGTRLYSSGSDEGAIQLRNIGMAEMEEILEDYEEGGREDSGYIVMDVRELNEIEYTGKLSSNTHSLPLQLLMRENVFALDEDEFEEVCGFQKPQPDETLVFSCAAGIRSVHAAKFAAMNGYSQLINYTGGANQWFSAR